MSYGISLITAKALILCANEWKNYETELSL